MHIKKSKTAWIYISALILVAGLAFGVQRALAVTPGLYEVEGNPSCADLYQATVISGPADDLSDLGPLFGFKYDANPTGNVSSTLEDDGTTAIGGSVPADPAWVVTNGPQDPNNLVSIFNVVVSSGEGIQFDWSATLGIDAVIVKARDSNAYVYSPEAFGDTGLTAPDGKAVSHVEFCYDYELAAEKTANAEYTRTYSWEITKDYDGTYDKFIGDPATTHGYEVSVDQTVADSDFGVSGTITVYNPSPYSVVFSVSDFVDSIEASVTCDDYALAPNDGAAGGADEEVCTYTAALGGPIDGTNTATISSENTNVKGAEATAAYTFGDPTTVVGFPTINVTDTNGESWMASGDNTWTYTRDFVCSTNPEEYTDGVDTDTYVNTATIDETGQFDDASVTVNCYIWDVSKTAEGSYNDQYGWDIEKTVNPSSQSGFAGETLEWTWSITWNSFFVEEINHAVSGVITVSNPAPMALTVDVVDYLTGPFSAAVTCNDDDGGTDLTIAASSTGTCNYSAAPDSQLTQNTAEATRNGITVSDTVDVNWVQGPDIGLDATISDSNIASIPVDASQPYTYTERDVCSTDTGVYGGSGSYSGSASNTAFITWTGGSDSSTADTSYDCYIPSISKTAAGTYDERHEWEVEKSVNPLSQSAFAGDTVTFDWTITVDETVFEENFDVSGTITVNNPNPEDALVVSLVDSVNGNPASIDQTSCAFDGGELTVQPNSSETCNYAANDLPYNDVDLAPDTNTATIMLNGIDFVATVPIEYTANVIRGSATLDDDQFPYSGEPVYNGWSKTYQDSYTCSSDLGDYTDGADLDNQVVNTAEVYSESALQDSSTAITEIDCYIPSISKTAAGTYDERHEWDVEKLVTPTYQEGVPGQVLGWTWTIDVFEDIYEENFDVSGTITVNNPNPEDTLVVLLSDVLSDGTVGVIDQASCAFDGTNLTVAAGGSETCSYAASDLGYTAPADAPGSNKATITLNGIDFEATDPIEYTANVIRGSATLSDDEIGLNDVPVSGGDQKTGDDSITCSTDRSVYGETGNYGSSVTNWAYLKDSEGNVYSDDATTEWLCKASFVDILKTTNGSVDPSKDIRFDLYSGTSLLETVTTLNDLDGKLPFQTALVPGGTYTVCESPVPAGYTFEITVDGGNVLTYAGPPGSSNPTGEIQCFDFTAAASPTTLLFQVNNRYPGGAPRTPGYWKNWNTCSGGNQAETAAKLGGVAEGVYLLDDLLPQTIGGFTIETCEDGVLVLDSRTLDRKEKKMSNDAAYTLARALLAARLNQDAGACDPDGLTWDGMTFEQVLTAADELLTEVGFDGTGDYLGPKNKKDKDLASDALWLYEIIDDYNNSELCTGEPSH